MSRSEAVASSSGVIEAIWLERTKPHPEICAAIARSKQDQRNRSLTGFFWRVFAALIDEYLTNPTDTLPKVL
jgi:hypothetical protein